MALPYNKPIKYNDPRHKYNDTIDRTIDAAMPGLAPFVSAHSPNSVEVLFRAQLRPRTRLLPEEAIDARRH